MGAVTAGLSAATGGNTPANIAAGAQGGPSATNEATNNWLSDSQKAQKAREIERDCGNQYSMACLKTKLKWFYRDEKQNVGTAVGLGGGIYLSAKEFSDGVADLIEHWDQARQVLGEIVNNPEFIKQVGAPVAEEYRERLQNLSNAYKDAGWDGSVTVGVEIGRLFGDVFGLASTVGGVGKLAAKLGTKAAETFAEASIRAGVAKAGGKAGDLASAGSDAGKAAGTANVEGNAGKNATIGTVSQANQAEIKQKALQSAQESYKGSTVVGHALSKHAGRNPEIWGKMNGSMSTWNAQGMKQLQEIIDAPGQFQVETYDNGLQFLEKRLPDGRGIRLNMDGTFKGFLD
jgi:hypothetical protein